MANISPISGFPEYLPAEQIVVRRVIDTIRQTYESFGFLPIETPIVERLEFLLAKGVADKEVYEIRRFHAASDEEGKGLGLRFDLTVPLARYVAQHYGKLHFPFRRYQIQPVWRGERPQRGRFRQFVQCDIDVIGDGALALDFDAEIPAVIFKTFQQLGVGAFRISVNNRKVLGGMLRSLGLTSDRDVRAALNIVDDLEKAGTTHVVQKLGELGLSSDKAESLIEFFHMRGTNEEILHSLRAMGSVNDEFEKGVDELAFVIEHAPLFVSLNYQDAFLYNVQHEREEFKKIFKIDLGIARGLDYYTGTVYETKLEANPAIGSVCSGGRYDNLTTNFTDKKLPGVGISIGLTRLLYQLFDGGILKADHGTIAPVLVTIQDQNRRNDYFEIGNRLRQGGVATEVFLERKPLGYQMKMASKRGFPIVIIASSDELDSSVVVVRNMLYGQEQKISLSQMVPVVNSMIPPGLQ